MMRPVRQSAGRQLATLPRLAPGQRIPRPFPGRCRCPGGSPSRSTSLRCIRTCEPLGNAGPTHVSTVQSESRTTTPHAPSTSTEALQAAASRLATTASADTDPWASPERGHSAAHRAVCRNGPRHGSFHACPAPTVPGALCGRPGTMPAARRETWQASSQRLKRISCRAIPRTIRRGDPASALRRGAQHFPGALAAPRPVQMPSRSPR